MLGAEYSPRARDDIDSAVVYIADRNPFAAERFLDAVEATVQTLIKFPLIGAAYPHPQSPDLRAKLVSSFRNYVIIYRVQSDQIGVVRVLHTAQDSIGALED